MNLKKQTRQIKFRAWDKTHSLMNYKVQVGNTDHADPNYTCNSIWVDSGDFKTIGWMNADENCIDLMQFTGLTDKNGKEIYEGDIIGGYPHGTIEVKWSDEWGSWTAYNELDDMTIEGESVKIPNYSLLSNDLNDCSDTWEVIGNIFENPELLQE
jgi:uncharacterized phage protein (TIGR01671 family)